MSPTDPAAADLRPGRWPWTALQALGLLVALWVGMAWAWRGGLEALGYAAMIVAALGLTFGLAALVGALVLAVKAWVRDEQPAWLVYSVLGAAVVTALAVLDLVN